MNVPQANDGPNIALGLRGAIARWLLTDRRPRSALGILGVSLVLWIPMWALAFFEPQGQYGLAAHAFVMLACAGGLLAISGLARIRRDFRKATTPVRKAVTLMAVLPLTALGALSLLFLAMIAIATLAKCLGVNIY